MASHMMCRQLGCDEQQDILRPYSTINYAWDEPSLPHKLVLSLPGNRVLGVFELDKVEFLCTCPTCGALSSIPVATSERDWP